MKSISELNEMTHEELVSYMAIIGIIIEDTTKEEIKDFYRNMLVPEKYAQKKMDSVIDDSDWIYKITNVDGTATSFSNDANLVIYSLQSIPPVSVTHK